MGAMNECDCRCACRADLAAAVLVALRFVSMRLLHAPLLSFYCNRSYCVMKLDYCVYVHPDEKFG